MAEFWSVWENSIEILRENGMILTPPQRMRLPRMASTSYAITSELSEPELELESELIFNESKLKSLCVLTCWWFAQLWLNKL